MSINLYFYHRTGPGCRARLTNKHTTMDKSIWLRVIRQELGLLDQLASGMIDDSGLSREEVELALTRSKTVVREFEMLLNQMVRQQGEAVQTAAVAAPEKQAEPAEVRLEDAAPVKEAKKKVEKAAGPVSEPLPGPEIPAGQAEEAVAQPLLAPVPPREAVENSGLLNISEQQEHAQFKAAPLKSLKEGLSLNDRYLFQRELFDNDKARLDDTVAALDRLGSIREAVDYLKSNFRWNKSEASEKFVHLVKRRFS